MRAPDQTRSRRTCAPLRRQRIPLSRCLGGCFRPRLMGGGGGIDSFRTRFRGIWVPRSGSFPPPHSFCRATLVSPSFSRAPASQTFSQGRRVHRSMVLSCTAYPGALLIEGFIRGIGRPAPSTPRALGPARVPRWSRGTGPDHKHVLCTMQPQGFVAFGISATSSKNLTSAVALGSGLPLIPCPCPVPWMWLVREA